MDTSISGAALARRDEVVAAGTATTMAAWRANTKHSRWRKLSRRLDKTELPGRESTSDSSRRSGDTRVPRHLLHLFWNTAPAQLEVRI